MTTNDTTDLAGLRDCLTGVYGLDLVRQHGGRVLAQLPVGVGKSVWMDRITEAAIQVGRYDLVIVLTPTRQLIEERGPHRHPLPGIKVVNLRPRPSAQCGPERDAVWKRYESADLGALGRAEICDHCPLRDKCYWPEQYGEALKGSRIIYGTQAHVERSPGFLVRLRSWAEADRVLTLIDEFDFGGTSYEETVPADQLDRFLDALREATPRCVDSRWQHERWLNLVEMLQDASLVDLQEPVWRMPPIYPGWALAVQRVGVERHGDTFRFLGYALDEFGGSPIETRRRAEGGGIEFSTPPYVGDCIIFSGTTDPAFARYRLGRNLASPFSGLRIIHPETRWYNIASPIGTYRYFARHVSQVLDFFALLTAHRIAAGKRVLLIAKKAFVPLCADGLADRFAGWGHNLEVVTGDWSVASLTDPRMVPLITYGMIGTNLFESFECCFTLTGYYVNESVINQCLQDLTRRDLRLPIRIETVGDPKRRQATVADPAHRDYDIARLAQPALEFLEHGVVVQAAGRVRPFTRPREVVTFQMAELPGVRYDAEFRTLNEARRFFEVPAGRERRSADRASRIDALRESGKTQVEVARILGVSVRTVRTYETQENRKKTILRI